MRPIPSIVSDEAIALLNKAEVLAKRLDDIDKSQHMDADTFSPSGTLPLSEGPSRKQKRGEQGRGVKVMNEGAESREGVSPPTAQFKTDTLGEVQSDRPINVAKSQPNYITSFNTEPQNMHFISETGGQTRSAHYTTNQHTLDSKDIPNKGATTEAFNLESLSAHMNPHVGGGVERLDDGGPGPVLKSHCNECGGNQYSGCRFDIPNCKNLQA